MKAIEVGDTIGDWPAISLYADSTIGRDTMPLFVPDVPSLRWVCRVCFAIRIYRLGKAIDRKFVDRYVDAVSMVNVLGPITDNDAGRYLLTSGNMQIFDNAVTTGRWLGIESLTSRNIPIVVNGIKQEINLDALNILDRISKVSRYSTLKTGDIIIFRDTEIAVEPQINTHIVADIADLRCLNIKVK